MPILPDARVFPRADFPLAVARSPRQAACDPHQHAFTELVVVLGGRGRHQTGASSYLVSAGDIFVVHPAQMHAFRAGSDLSILSVLYHPEGLPLPTPYLRKLSGYHALFFLEPRYRAQHQAPGRLQVSPEELARISASIQRMEAEITHGAPGYEAMALAEFIHLIGLLSRGYGQLPPQSTPPMLRLAEVLTLAETRYMERLTQQRLAASIHLSTSHFARVFREVMGVAPMEYVIRLRLRKAAELLRTTPASITEIASQVGLHDSNYFTRLFKQYQGVTPRRYRQLHEEE